MINTIKEYCSEWKKLFGCQKVERLLDQSETPQGLTYDEKTNTIIENNDGKYEGDINQNIDAITCIKSILNRFSEDMHFIMTLGYGNFGRVELHASSYSIYAIKFSGELIKEVFGLRMSKVVKTSCTPIGWVQNDEGELGIVYDFIGGRVSRETFYQNLESDLKTIKSAHLQHCDIATRNIGTNGHLLDNGCMTNIGDIPKIIGTDLKPFKIADYADSDFDKRCKEALPENLYQRKLFEWNILLNRLYTLEREVGFLDDDEIGQTTLGYMLIKIRKCLSLMFTPIVYCVFSPLILIFALIGYPAEKWESIKILYIILLLMGGISMFILSGLNIFTGYLGYLTGALMTVLFAISLLFYCITKKDRKLTRREAIHVACNTFTRLDGR
jgi:hypothetical protein